MEGVSQPLDDGEPAERTEEQEQQMFDAIKLRLGVTE